MIVYNTNTGGTASVGNTQGTLTPGYWYYENKSGSETGGTWKPLSSGSSVGSALTGTTSIVIDGDSIMRAALTGDVTAAANSTATMIATGVVNTAKLADNSVTSAKIADATIVEADLADNAVATAKIAAGAVTAAKLNAMGASTGQVLTYDGSKWAPAAATGGMGTAGNGNYVRLTSISTGRFTSLSATITYTVIACSTGVNSLDNVTLNGTYIYTTNTDGTRSAVNGTITCVFQTF
jgi:hypothetical protein